MKDFLRVSSLLLAFALIVPCCSKCADDSAVLGVWRGNLGSVPAVTLNVERQGGNLVGAIVFYFIRRGEAGTQTSSPGIPEPILDPAFDGSTLTFKVSHKNAHPPRTLNDPPVQFEFTVSGPGRALLKSKELPPALMVRDGAGHK
jgi:hypothetical protein